MRVGINLCDMFPFKNGLKQRAAPLPLFFNCALGYAIRRVQIIQDGLKLNGLHQFLLYADDINMLEGSVHTVEENEQALIMARKILDYNKC